MAAAPGAPLSSAAGRIAASASSIVMREVRGYHKVTIDGFAASMQCKKTLKGWYWSSQTFQLGGFSWQVQYVPHAGGDHIGLHLELIDHGASGSLPAHVHPVEFGFSLLDQATRISCERPHVRPLPSIDACSAVVS
ncbi:hypothetical protein EJB05_01118, partial [Eragrostis curvula]